MEDTLVIPKPKDGETILSVLHGNMYTSFIVKDKDFEEFNNDKILVQSLRDCFKVLKITK